MPITEVTSDPEALTLTIVGDYAVPVDRLWKAWVDPRQIERFWGPPKWPATFTRHDMAAGGRSDYFMTGPDGERIGGCWQMQSIDEGVGFTGVDGFTDPDGGSDAEMPTMAFDVRFETTDDGSRFVSVTTFPSHDAMEQLVAMGVIEGMETGLGQMSDVLADLASFAADRSTDMQLLTETTARFSRVIRGTVAQVWAAHHDPALIRQWMLGPDGWAMSVCEPATVIGDRFHYAWTSEVGGPGFGLEGDVLESTPPRREVTTEKMSDMDGPSTRNETTLTATAEGTLVVLVITYPSSELREQIMATGMLDGLEASYARLERTITGATS